MRPVRLVALLLGLAVLAWIPLILVVNRPPDPTSASGFLPHLAVLFLGPVCLLALFLIVRHLVKRTQPSAETREIVRWACRWTGPFGGVWSVFKLTSGV